RSLRRWAHQRGPPGPKRRQTASPQEGALAGAGRANHRSEARAAQVEEHRPDFLFTAEEEPRVLLREGQEAGKRISLGASGLLVLELECPSERSRGRISILRG